jgi:hypothetical protein
MDLDGREVKREAKASHVTSALTGRGNHRHFMEKELQEHPGVLGDTLRQYMDPVTRGVALPTLPFDPALVPRITISACGSAYLAGMVGKYWIEEFSRIPCDGDVASELRYRDPPLPPGGGAILVSQSGETADTLAALKMLRERGQTVLSIVNVPESSMARLSNAALLTVAGPEIGVASTKAAAFGMHRFNAVSGEKVCFLFRGMLAVWREKRDAAGLERLERVDDGCRRCRDRRRACTAQCVQQRSFSAATFGHRVCGAVKRNDVALCVDERCACALYFWQKFGQGFAVCPGHS